MTAPTVATLPAARIRAGSDNPWTQVDAEGSGPYVLPDDRPFVDAFNHALHPKPSGTTVLPSAYVRTDLMPEPWLGRRNAPVCLLLLNPGFSEADRPLHADRDFRVRLAAALRDDDAPHFHLAAPAQDPGRRWWSAALATVVREMKLRDVSQLQHAVSCIQLFPYHSVGFGHAGIRLPSQAATVARVREHLANGTMLIVRSWLSWLGLVPELADVRYRGHVFPLYGRGVRVHENTLGRRPNLDAIIAAARPSIAASIEG